MSVDTTTALARVAAAKTPTTRLAERSRSLLARWEASEDRHYAIAGLRWAPASSPRGGDAAARTRARTP